MLTAYASWVRGRADSLLATESMEYQARLRARISAVRTAEVACMDIKSVLVYAAYVVQVGTA